MNCSTRASLAGTKPGDRRDAAAARPGAARTGPVPSAIATPAKSAAAASLGRAVEVIARSCRKRKKPAGLQSARGSADSRPGNAPPRRGPYPQRVSVLCGLVAPRPSGVNTFGTSCVNPGRVRATIRWRDSGTTHYRSGWSEMRFHRPPTRLHRSPRSAVTASASRGRDYLRRDAATGVPRHRPDRPAIPETPARLRGSPRCGSPDRRR